MATSSSNQITIILFCLLSTIIFNSSSLLMYNSMIIHCDEKDENTLLKFKHEVTDPSGVLSSWSSDEEKDCCQWRGVHCDNITHRVTELHLPCDTIQSDEILDKDNEKSHCLTGSSYVYFKVVTKYMVLDFVHPICLVDLSSNNFSGTIPSELFMLTGLQSLNLSHNQLMGSISQHAKSHWEHNLRVSQTLAMLEIQNFVDLHSQNFAHKMRNYQTKNRREKKKMMMMIALKYGHGFLWGWELDLPQAFGEYWVLFFSTENSDMVISDF
ncbi:probable LRR receptor-like serine/threonine-protein kinase RPK1 isoform X2 [Arachis stenosperma]|uniref:probable LRR receptor-like serine/threonine-protein kinase RPK1 isoform X2 n=1 Tax=Arachis stenosperma TaxID=217475 RepID=UPI0025ACD7DF|nr:probable LRR receptor-like serine/threonine-protein kinase RPK1 isoform X2 [Arachis stenosperma]